MKKQGLFLYATLLFALAGCGGGNNGSNAAAVPQSCGTTGIPNQYCSNYNVNGYGVNNYSNYCGASGAGYGGGYGWGTSQPCNQGLNYPCPYGSQPVAAGYGGQIYCGQSSYLSNYGNPTYAPNYAWSGGYTGYGPVIACNPARGSIDCGYTSGLTCVPNRIGNNTGWCQ